MLISRPSILIGSIVRRMSKYASLRSTPAVSPVILGEIASVSSDRLTDETTHQPYYLGRVSVNKLQIPEELREQIRAGMPAEVIAPLGDRWRS